MRKFFIALLVFIALAVPAAAFEDLAADSTAQLTQLQARLDSLEAELEKMKMAPVSENPLRTGEFLKWGQGLNLAFRGSGPNVLEVEMNYNRLFGPLKWSIFDSGSARYGLSVGALIFEDEHNFDNQTESVYVTDGRALYAGMSIDSPVLLNFISFNQYIAPMYITGSRRGGKEHSNWGFKYRVGLEFWFSSGLSLTLGAEGQGDFEHGEDDGDQGLFPWKLRTSFGTRFYF